MNPDYLWLTDAMQFLAFFVVGPVLAIAIAVSVASGVTALLLFGFAKWMNADVRTAQYFLQLTCILLSGLLFGVCVGCFFPVLLRVWRWHKDTTSRT